MENLIIEATDETPKIVFDLSNDVFLFNGRSLPEDVRSFYLPVLEWLNEYSSLPKKNTIVEFKMEYFNTASSKIFLDILLKLEEIYSSGNKLTIKWYSKENDPDMKEAGEEYAEIVEVPFEHLSY